MRKYFPKSVATLQGHLNQISKNEISTQIPIPITMKPINSETYLLFATVFGAVKVYSYQTGHFPVTFIKGVKYAFILYSYDANAIFQIPARAELYRKFYMPTESFQLQMGFSFPFLRANDLRSSLLNIRARSFLLSCS